MDAMLKIRVVSHGGRPPDTPLEARLDRSGGTIGRLATNQLVLPDPERRVSGVHARITCGPNGYLVLREGRNPLLLNGTPLRAGDQAPLRDGDELAVSSYRLRVSLTDRGAGRAPIRSTPRSALYYSWETEMGLDRVAAAAESPCGGDAAGDAGERAAMQGDDASLSDIERGAQPGQQARATGASEARSSMPADATMRSFFDAARTREALDAALQRFNPAHLEQRLRHGFIFDSVLSGHHKARLWDAFGSLYTAIACEVRDEIRSVLLQEFKRASEEQVQRPMPTESDQGESR
jgi:predicted component of type VI protein secretion system